MLTAVFRWLALAVVSLIFTALAMLLAPVLPLAARNRRGLSDNARRMTDEPRLPPWLSWFQTPDNSLWGDVGWRTIHCQDHWDSYLGMVLWLWRNPAYGFEGSVLAARIGPASVVTWSGDTGIRNQPVGRAGRCFTKVMNEEGTIYWHLYWVRPISAGRCLNVNLGWKLKTYAEVPARVLIESRAMFCCSPRIAEWQP